ncbi:MAG TPA: ABC transporter substrate-binding protein [Syntrophorhabdaceae bacterium]|nr:ABC transporter substrate-binding protein [Syntrophorhabdaceae bacterium]
MRRQCRTQSVLRLFNHFALGAVCFFLGLAIIAVAAGDVYSAPTPGIKRVIIAVPSEPDTLDLSNSKIGTAEAIGANITERLINITPDGKLVPGLAQSWKVSTDGKDIDYFLRKGVVFHSGDPFTAKDVQFSHERAMKYFQGYQRTMKFLESFTVIDDYHVKFRFKTPDAQVLPNRGTPIGSKTYHDRVGEENYVRQPVGTGPYQFIKWEPGQFIEMKIFENYWGSPPFVKEVRFIFIGEDTTRVSKLMAGEVDMIVDCPFPKVNEVEKAGFVTARMPTHPTVSIQFHTYNPKVPWYDRRVRMAIAMAIDRKTIVNNLFQGIPNMYPRLCPWELGYDAGITAYPYDPQKAKKLLAEAGYPKGFDMPLYYFMGRISGQKETTEAVALYLNNIGIRVKIEGLEAVRFIEKVREWHKSTDTIFAGVATVPLSGYPEPTQALEIAYFSESAISLYKNLKFDEILNKARIVLDNKKRAVLIKDAVRLIHEDVATIPIWSNVTIFATKKDISYKPTRNVANAIVFVKNIEKAR